MSSLATPRPSTLRISRRQLADAAYRALRVAGLPSGLAASAAQDAVELQHTRGRGLQALDAILATGPRPLSAPCRSNGRDSVDAQQTSALLIAVPIAALASYRVPSKLTICNLAYAGALEPALLRSARMNGTEFLLTAGGDRWMLRVRPDGAVTGPSWDTGWAMLSCDAHLFVEHASGAVTAPPPPVSQLVVERTMWERLASRALLYLV